MQRRHLRISLVALLFLQLTGSSFAQQDRKWQRVLIETRKPYDAIVRAIEARGGHVTQQFTSIDAIAAELPEESVQSIGSLPGVQTVSKDVEIQRPENVDPVRSRGNNQATQGVITTEASNPLGRISPKDLKDLASTHAEVYSLNNAGTRIDRLHAMGLTGEGTVVAVIDSGVRGGYKLVQDSVIGGFDFVDDGAPGPAGDGEADWKKNSNDGHGTFAAGLIAGNASFVVKGVLKDALNQYAPGALVDDKLPLIGTAPNARIYAVRVFGDSATSGASVSTILAAIQHVIDQRVLYDTSQGKKGVKISVANLSLGVFTLAAGQTPLDKMLGELLNAGIVPVVSVGNVGPSALTTSSPGSSRSAITVGGTGPATNERILNEVLYGTQFPDEYYPGIGRDIRPFNPTETAWFSSRGPNADGRLDPDVMASGLGNIGQGYCPDQILDACSRRLSIGSGTSFSAPIVSGIAAVLVQAFPQATATQIRNAIIAAGRTSEIANFFDDVDRGRGLVDAYGAYNLLASDTVPDILPPFSPPWGLSVKSNIEQNPPGLHVDSGSVTDPRTGLMPGQRAEILYDVPPNTSHVVVRVNHVVMNGPQNAFYGTDRLFFYIHSAKTSSIGAFGNYLVDGELFVGGEDETFTLNNPDTGIMRITVNPDTLNAGTVDVQVSVDAIPAAPESPTITGSIRNGELLPFSYNVDNQTARLDFVLTWDDDWGHYPTSDVDLIVCSPAIAIADCRTLGNKKAATLASPERVSIENPIPGVWNLLVHGFNVPTETGTGADNFRLSITKVAKP